MYHRSTPTGQTGPRRTIEALKIAPGLYKGLKALLGPIWPVGILPVGIIESSYPVPVAIRPFTIRAQGELGAQPIAGVVDARRLESIRAY